MMTIWRRMSALRARLSGPAGAIAPPGMSDATGDGLVPAGHSSATGNFVKCVETGTNRAILHRYVRHTLGLTPDQYRQKWGLPDDYPMVSNSYRKRRLAAQTSKISE